MYYFNITRREFLRESLEYLSKTGQGIFGLAAIIQGIDIQFLQLLHFKNYAIKFYEDLKNKKLSVRWPIIYNGIIDNSRVSLHVERIFGDYDLEMRVYDAEAVKPSLYGWREGKAFDTYIDAGIKGHLLGANDHTHILDKTKMEVMYYGPEGSYEFRKWRKPMKNEICRIDSEVFEDCIDGTAYHNPKGLINPTEKPILTGVYQQIGHEALLKRRKLEMKQSSMKYQKYLKEIIEELEREWKLKF